MHLFGGVGSAEMQQYRKHVWHDCMGMATPRYEVMSGACGIKGVAWVDSS